MSIRTILVGLGKQAVENHLPAILQSHQHTLVGLCDIDLDLVNRLKGEHAVYGSNDLNEIIRDVDFDAAVVCLPHQCYEEAISALASAGKHILKEKPFATNADEAARILQIVRSNNIYLGVMVQRRFNPIYQSFHQLKHSIGKIYSVEGSYTMNVPNLDSGWRASKELSGGGALVDMGYHFIDLLIWYFGMPNSVTARLTRGNRHGQRYDVEDTAHLLFDYSFGSGYNEKMVGTFVISRVHPTKQEYIRALGTLGSIEVSRGIIRRLDEKGNPIEELERKGGWPSAAVEQLDYFAKRIKADPAESSADYNEHLQHVAVIEAAYESDRSRACCRPNDFLQELESERKL